MSVLWRRPRRRAEEPRIHLRVLWLPSSDVHHGGHGDASHAACADGVVLGRAFDGDAFQRHVGAAIGGSTRSHLQNSLAAGAETAALDGRSGSRASRKVVEVDQAEVFREGDAFFEPGNAGKILVVGAVEVIERDTHQSKPRRKHAKYLDTRSGRVRLAVNADNTAASLEAFVRANVKPGATLLTDGHASYPGLTDYRHDPRVVGKMAAHVVLPWIHRVFALMKRWGLGTHHGLRRKHVDTFSTSSCSATIDASTGILRSKQCSASRRTMRRQAIGTSSAATIRAREPLRLAARREAERQRPECVRTALPARKRRAQINLLPCRHH